MGHRWPFQHIIQSTDKGMEAKLSITPRAFDHSGVRATCSQLNHTRRELIYSSWSPVIMTFNILLISVFLPSSRARLWKFGLAGLNVD